MRVVKSVPEDQHADQDEDGGNDIPDKVHPMDALTATKASVFVIDIKTIPALHITNQPRQKSSDYDISGYYIHYLCPFGSRMVIIFQS